jgi:hypothetical protein
MPVASPWSFFAILALLLALCSLPTSAQEGQPPATGIVTGAVVDATSREPLSGANVSLAGTSLGAVSDSAGRFTIVSVPPGTYQVRVALLGYQAVVVTDVVVSRRAPADIVARLAESPVELAEASVTAGYFVKSPDAPVSTRSQANEEIRRLPGGFEDVVRAVSILPGVAQAEAGRNDLIVRGGAPSENLFVVDNLEVFNINHFGTQGASGGPLSFINLDFVRQTTFSSGGFGARYGDKLSSVLSIDLREGRRDRLGAKAVVSASQFGLNLEGPVGPDGTFLVSARRSYLDFIFKAAKLAFVPQYWDFFAKGTYALGANDRLTLLALGAVDDVKLFGETPEDRYDNSRILYSDQDIAIMGLSWTHTFGDGYWLVTAGRSYVDFDYRQRDTLMSPVFTNRSIETETSLRADLVTHLAKRTELTVGAQVKGAGIRSAILLPGFWTNYGQFLSVDRRLDTTGVKSAAYAQLSQQIGRWRATAGVRADHFNLLREKLVVAPRASLAYTLSDAMTVSASGGVYYQAPSLVWIAANEANAGLRFVRATQGVLGIDRLLGSDATVSLELYAKHHSDYPASLTQPFLVLANTGAGYGGSQEAYASFGIDPLTSAGRGNARGVELFFQKKLSETPWYAIASLSFNEARFTALDGVERPGAFDQRWILNLGGGYLFNERWEAAMKFRLATGRPYTPYNPDGTQDAGNVYGDRIGVNHSLDVRVDRRWTFDDWNLITYIDIQNLYNKKPSRIPTFNERTMQLDTPKSIGILPSIGLTAEF